MWSVQQEANLTEVGEMVLPDLLVSSLRQRLQVEDWYRRHPEIDDEPIEAPLIGLGLPRTGSTALSFLLGRGPAARSLLRWEAAEPCPPPSTVDGPDPRIAGAEAGQQMQTSCRPEAPRWSRRRRPAPTSART